VTTSVGGIAYLVRDHKTALVVELGDAGQLAAALIELLADPERRETLSATGRAHVERRFAWNTRVDDWLALYERALR
jgi:glycosyltransferase involved in cell wall biosynthesis